MGQRSARSPGSSCRQGSHNEAPGSVHSTQCCGKAQARTHLRKTSVPQLAIDRASFLYGLAVSQVRRRAPASHLLFDNLPMSEPERLRKRRVQRNFARAAAQYESFAVLSREVAARMLERLALMQLTPQRVLDLGSGTGIAARALAE